MEKRRYSRGKYRYEEKSREEVEAASYWKIVSRNWKMQERQMKEDVHQNGIISITEIRNELKEDTQKLRKEFELEDLLGKLFKTIIENEIRVRRER
jgi:broad specificity polyphosphatase/5'/3'-nucleotidase SurE